MQLAHHQPNTPTPDVEKIASNAVAQWCLASRNWTGYDMPDQQQKRLSEIMTKALAQARAPLVAVLTELRDFLRSRDRTTRMNQLIGKADAVITGTEEKE